jgi:hypothetical protein
MLILSSIVLLRWKWDVHFFERGLSFFEREVSCDRGSV